MRTDEETHENKSLRSPNPKDWTSEALTAALDHQAAYHQTVTIRGENYEIKSHHDYKGNRNYLLSIMEAARAKSVHIPYVLEDAVRRPPYVHDPDVWRRIPRVVFHEVPKVTAGDDGVPF